MALTLLLIRHGETVYNAENRYQGQQDIPLSATGREQARRLGERLGRAWRPSDRGAAPRPALPGPPCAVYASDLGRAAETAALAVAPLSGMMGQTYAVRSLADLRERHFGVWEGLTAGEIRSRFPGHTEPENGEVWPAVWTRMNRALGTIWEEHARPATGDAAHPPPVVLVVGHGGSLRAFVCRALGVDHEHVRRFRLDNASLSVAEFWGPSLEESAGRISLLNDTAHLTE